MKRFTVPCDFKDQKWPFHLYVGEPSPDRHPLANQSRWLSQERGGFIPSEVMESFSKLHDISKKNNVSFEELCVYALAGSNAQEQPKPQESAQQDPTSTKEEAKPVSSVGNVIAPHADSLFKSTLPETAFYTLETARMIWPLENDQSKTSRILFLALALYIAVEPQKVLTVSEIYRMLTLSDSSYSLSVVLDTKGKFLSRLAYTAIMQWLNCTREEREQLVLYMITTLVDFSMAPYKSKTDQAMRKALYQTLMSENVT